MERSDREKVAIIIVIVLGCYCVKIADRMGKREKMKRHWE